MRCVGPETDGLENSVRAIDFRAFGAGFPPMTARGSNLTPARSDGLDNVDGGPDAAFYIQMGVIEQVSIRGRFQRCNRPVLVPFVALDDVGQHRRLIRRLAPGPRLHGAA